MLFRNSQRPRREGRPAPLEPYHAVSIAPGPERCQACLGLEGVRFLSGEAPPLPLPGCDMACGCVYRHYPDRREPSLMSRYFPQTTGQPERRR